MRLEKVVQFFMVRAFEGIVAIALVILMPNVPPDAKFNKSFSVTPSMPLENKLTLNERLNNAELWHKGDFVGPEAFAEYNGELYTTIHGGDVVKLTGSHITPVVKFGKPCKGIYQEQICGRPLGLTFDKSGALYVADAYYGLFKVDIKTGKKLQLVSVDQEINGMKPKLPNSVVVASNGDLYWTDSSTEFTLQDGLFDMLADGSGRLIHYDAKTKKNNVILDGLHFANGVILSKDETFLLVAETARSRIHRHYLKGPKKGTSDIFIDGLPGLPDNLHSDGKDGFLVPLVVAKDALHPSPFQIFGPFPIARKFFARLLGLAELGFRVLDQVYPNEYAERGMHLVGHFTMLTFVLPSRVTVLHVSKSGEIIDSLHALDKSISGISEAFVFKDKLYLGSPFNDYIARVPLAKAGLNHLASSFDGETKTSENISSKSQPKETRSPPPPPTKAPTIKVTSTKQPIPTQGQTTKQPTPTQAPTTKQPIPTQAPTTKHPVPTQAPTTKQPVPKQVPTTKQPIPTQAPTTKQPIPTQAPTTTQPTPTQAPTTTQPIPKQVPTTKQPIPKQASTTKEPAPKQAPTAKESNPKPAPTTKESAPKQAPITESPVKSTAAPKQQSQNTAAPPKKEAPSANTASKESVKQSKTTTDKQSKDSSTEKIPKSDIK